MISNAVIQTLAGYAPRQNISLSEPMSRHTTFRIGGEADCFVELENTEQLVNIQRYLRMVEQPYLVIGNGSNLLVSDRGYAGVVLQVGSRMQEIRIEGERMIVQAGALMSKVASVACEQGLTGFEFASGIPGTIGGGVIMNAGAYDGEISQVVTQVKVVDREGNELELDNATMEFGYRTSAIKHQPFTVVEVTLQLARGERGVIRERMDELAAKRRQKQPLEYPSAGSTFKRPEGYYAGELIMKSGLRGYQIGGARVSDKHCGFIINTGKATCEDVLDLIAHVQERVKDCFGVDLETEVIYVQ
ncbi:MAG: UDP-N-acetylmuramate dehydrogenase [bacterium]|nr:UDP-N-acetylmuramate dehydrogenase [bacterium]MCM1374551.1 UDP-N-acetylmuramate dehydrogenase [Muribaculum sp.]